MKSQTNQQISPAISNQRLSEVAKILLLGITRLKEREESKNLSDQLDSKIPQSVIAKRY